MNERSLLDIGGFTYIGFKLGEVIYKGSF